MITLFSPIFFSEDCLLKMVELTHFLQIKNDALLGRGIASSYSAVTIRHHTQWALHYLPNILLQG